jgi:hypothetical protein
MGRRSLLLLAALSTLVLVSFLSARKKADLLVFEWARKAPAHPVPVAILIELGLKDAQAGDWSGQAQVSGAKVLRRETYRFRPGDKLVGQDGWEAKTRKVGARNRRATTRPQSLGVVLYLTDLKPEASLAIQIPGKPLQAKVPLQAVLAGQPRNLWTGRARVRQVSSDREVVSTKTEDDFPAAAYGPDGTLYLAYISYTLKDRARRFQAAALSEQPKDFKSFYKPEFGDQLFVKYRHKEGWTEPLAITGPHEDLVRCAVAVDGKGLVWVAYSAHRKGNFDIYARTLRIADGKATLGEEQQLTTNPEPDLAPTMCTDQSGQVHLACQSWGASGKARMALLHCPEGKWTAPRLLEEAELAGNCWHPFLVAGPEGTLALAYDCYWDGDYDVRLALIEGDRITQQAVANTPQFEVRPSLAYDLQGRLWIAYEEGPEKWGKDFGALVKDEGKPLYSARTVRLCCLQEGKWFRPEAELPQREAIPENQGRRTRRGYARVGVDGKGRVWLTYRLKMTTPFGVQPGTEWVSVARQLEGKEWSASVELLHADGLLDSRPVLLPRGDGGLLAVTNTDGRRITPGSVDNQIQTCVLDLAGKAVEPSLRPLEQTAKEASTEQAQERAAVRRLRTYRLELAGKTYQILRGEFHRHTEISFDGGGDGSLEDMFRYAIDVAAMDWIGNGDHDNGSGREYPWWLTQKFNDAYHVSGHFAPMFTYERSVSYPHGHRNCMFAQRGVLTLPRLAQPDRNKRVAGIHANDTKMLYRYLHEMKGLCAVHTSATSMGTDWRDNDPAVEPLVEIYQGDRNSYEMEGAPRAGYEAGTGKTPVNIAGWYPKGYVSLALAKGYRLGFQSSSDHISTHISYCLVLAADTTRQAILEGMLKRHSYGATDNILLEVRSGEHLMGDSFRTREAPKLQIKVVGTGKLKAVEVLRDSRVVHTFTPGKEELATTWTDPKPARGEHWYYIRVQQENGELAWSSPMWITQGS